jgi:HEAT repeat protein
MRLLVSGLGLWVLLASLCLSGVVEAGAVSLLELEGRLESKDPVVVREAVGVLNEMGSRESLDLLLRVFRRVEGECRLVVAEGVLTTGFVLLERGAGRVARKGFHQVRKARLSDAMTVEATRGLILSDPGSGTRLLTGLIRHRDPLYYGAGIDLAGELEGDGVTRALVKLLPKVGMPQQAMLAEALGGRRDPLALPALLDLAVAGERRVRVPALRAVAHYPENRAVDVLIRTAMGGDVEMRQAAEDGMVSMPAEANTILSAQLIHADEAKVLCVIRVLGLRGASEVQGVLMPYVSDEKLEVRTAAIRALGACATSGSWTTLVACLLQAEQEREREVAHAALVDAMGRFEDKSICVGALATALPSAPEPTRSLVIDLLGRAGDPKVIPALLPYVTPDTPEPTRGNALRALRLAREEGRSGER